MRSPRPVQEIIIPGKEALALQSSALVIDLHNDLLTKLTHLPYRIDRRHRPPGIYNPLRLEIDLPRLSEGGVNALGCLLFGGFRIARRARFWAQLATFERLLASYPDKLVQARCPDDVRRAQKDGKVALFLGVEGAYPLLDDPLALPKLARAGVVFLGPLWMRSNALGGSATDGGSGAGLTERGRAFLEEVERHGLLIDVAHASDRTTEEVIDRAARTPFSSHSGCKAVYDHPRNLNDALLRKLGQRGGIVGIVFAAHYLGKMLSTTVDTIADHLCHAVEVMGIDHVALGSDFDGFVPLPKGMRDVSSLPRLTEVLLRRGMSSAEVAAVLGGNVLRYWSSGG